MTEDELYMDRCLLLATYGKGYVAPNPMVGAVLVYQNRIIGEGWHAQFGGPHAEVNCINSVQEPNRKYISEATLYVSLEPCCHTGKTPPCTNLIIQQQIRKVVIACRDPFSKVNGGGIQQLRANNIEVIEGVFEQEARWLNRHFFTFHEKRRPYVLLKWAQTADGFIAGESWERLKITNEVGDSFVHALRSEYAAIMVGTHTAIVDNPMLTNRLMPGPSPLRIVVDNKLTIPSSHYLLSDGRPTVIINESKEEVQGKLIYVLKQKEKSVVDVVLDYMYRNNLNSLMVEGGQRLQNSFIEAGAWDEACIITAMDKRIHKGVRSAILLNELRIGESRLGEMLIERFKHN